MMKEVKVGDLHGAALDWAVAQVTIQSGEFTTDSEEHGTGRPYFNCKNGEPCLWGSGVQAIGTMNAKTGNPWVMHGSGGGYSPSTDWRQGGPMIELHKIWLGAPIMERKRWDASVDFSVDQEIGDTPLIAACRAIVASKLGDVVQIPDELVN